MNEILEALAAIACKNAERYDDKDPERNAWIDLAVDIQSLADAIEAYHAAFLSTDELDVAEIWKQLKREMKGRI